MHKGQSSSALRHITPFVYSKVILSCSFSREQMVQLVSCICVKNFWQRYNRSQATARHGQTIYVRTGRGDGGGECVICIPWSRQFITNITLWHLYVLGMRIVYLSVWRTDHVHNVYDAKLSAVHFSSDYSCDIVTDRSMVINLVSGGRWRIGAKKY